MDIFKLNRHLCRLLRKKVKIKANGRCGECCGRVWEAEGFELLAQILRIPQGAKYNLGKRLSNSQNWGWEGLGEPCEVRRELGPASCVVHRAAGQVQFQSVQNTRAQMIQTSVEANWPDATSVVPRTVCTYMITKTQFNHNPSPPQSRSKDALSSRMRPGFAKFASGVTCVE